MSSTVETKASIIPCLRYRNAAAAIEWLCETFGFEKQVVFPHPDGTIAHAQLTFGHSMIMIGSVGPGPIAHLFQQPDEAGGAETQCPYVIVKDADAVYEKAKAAGAWIEVEIQDAGHGGRSFTCRDLEGHVWNFGTFDPWAMG